MRFLEWKFPKYTFYRNGQILVDISQKPIAKRIFPKSVFPLTIYINNVIWTDKACNILYENGGVGVCNFWSFGIKFVYILKLLLH